MAVDLYDDQKKAVNDLKSGAILCGGVGSGKSITSLAYFYTKECGGVLPTTKSKHYPILKNPKPLYIITTAKKRDDLEWEKEFPPFLLSTDPAVSQTKVTIDSWNNIKKYKDVKDAFFIFDEQRLVGYGVWVKSFFKIADNNHWILLSATPGDTWMDYMPVFIANGFYKNKTQFVARHVIYDRYSKFPKIDKYLDTRRLEYLRDSITVRMEYQHTATQHHIWEKSGYDVKAYDTVWIGRWDIWENRPIKNNSKACYLARKVCNSDTRRLESLKHVMGIHPKIIVFYNFLYEVDMLMNFAKNDGIPYSRWNGQKHENIPETDRWLYFVQYSAGHEGWNCTETNAMAFYSQNYSYRVMTQAAGRIDRRDTKYKDLYYYHFFSDAKIEKQIKRSYNRKKDFNEYNFYKKNAQPLPEHISR